NCMTQHLAELRAGCKTKAEAWAQEKTIRQNKNREGYVFFAEALLSSNSDAILRRKFVIDCKKREQKASAAPRSSLIRRPRISHRPLTIQFNCREGDDQTNSFRLVRPRGHPSALYRFLRTSPFGADQHSFRPERQSISELVRGPIPTDR